MHLLEDIFKNHNYASIRTTMLTLGTLKNAGVSVEDFLEYFNGKRTQMRETVASESNIQSRRRARKKEQG